MEGRISRIFLEHMQLDIPSVDTDLIASGGLDSLAFVDLLLHLERACGVRFHVDDLDIEQFRSIRRIADLMRVMGHDAQGGQHGRGQAVS